MTPPPGSLPSHILTGRISQSQALIDRDPYTKSTPSPVFKNQIKTERPFLLRIVYSCFHVVMAKLSMTEVV